MNRRTAIALFLTVSLCVPTTQAQETQPNDFWSQAQTIAAQGGTQYLTASLATPFDASAADFNFAASLSPDQVDEFIAIGTAGSWFSAWIDNTPSGFPGSPDTVLRSLDETWTELRYNDDGGPLGTNLASGLVAKVNSDGSIRLQVSGYPDVFFNGGHPQSGDYQLLIDLGARGDVDFFRITGLVPGSSLVVETDNTNVDTLLAWYDDFGMLLESDDDGGLGLTSSLDGIVPASGSVTVAVTSFTDPDFAGDHNRFGDYQLAFTGLIPEPSAFVLAAMGLLALVGTARRCIA